MKLRTLEIMIKLRLCLPTTNTDRDKVIKKEINEYKRLYLHQSSHKASKQTRETLGKRGTCTSCCIHRHFNAKEFVFMYLQCHLIDNYRCLSL